eukprot:4855777-Ditylum_brightwellii.AAC.1
MTVNGTKGKLLYCVIPLQKDVHEWVPLYALLGLPTDTMPPFSRKLLCDEDMESIGWKVITISRE